MKSQDKLIEINKLKKFYGKARGVIRATSGEARIFGKDVWKDRQTTLARLGYLPSEINFYKNQSVNDVLKLAASSRWDGGKSEGMVGSNREKLIILRK